MEVGYALAWLRELGYEPAPRPLAPTWDPRLRAFAAELARGLEAFRGNPEMVDTLQQALDYSSTQMESPHTAELQALLEELRSARLDGDRDRVIFASGGALGVLGRCGFRFAKAERPADTEEPWLLAFAEEVERGLEAFAGQIFGDLMLDSPRLLRRHFHAPEAQDGGENGCEPIAEYPVDDPVSGSPGGA
jgi:hypothetical protein